MLARKAKVLSTSPTQYPNQSFIKTEKGYFYISNKEKRYRFISTRVLNSWAPPRIIHTTEAAVAGYRVAAKMKFRNGSLIHNLADGKIYLISDGKRRHITSPDALERIGAVEKDVVSVSLEEVNLHEEGAVLS